MSYNKPCLGKPLYTRKGENKFSVSLQLKKLKTLNSNIETHPYVNNVRKSPHHSALPCKPTLKPPQDAKIRKDGETIEQFYFNHFQYY
ncbi:hypothetical protein J6590_108123, partial [Homalodisca vitripennis]